MSEAESPERLAAGRRPTVADIRALSGPATPHFAGQIAARIAKLIGPLEPGDPVRIEGETQIEKLANIAQLSGEARGAGPSGGHG